MQQRNPLSKGITKKTLRDIEDAAAEGATTIGQIAEAVGIKKSTFDNYLYRIQNAAGEKRRDSIYEAIERGMERQRDNIARAAENSLLKLVTGEQYEETTVEQRMEKGKDGKEKKVQFKKTVVKHRAPNATAVIFALCNADNDGNWESINRPKGEDTVTGNLPDGVTFEFDGDFSYTD